MAKTLADLRDEMRAVARDERGPSPRPAASVLTLTASTLELLHAIATHPGTTVSGLAQRLGLDRFGVSRSLQRLAGHGLFRTSPIRGVSERAHGHRC